jgi:uncharacterized oxidoreductase
MRIPFYLDALKKGEVVSNADFTVLREMPAALAADGHWGFGQVQARRLMEQSIAKARGKAGGAEARLRGESGLLEGGSGVCVGTLVRCSHIGRLGEYCEQAAEAGMVSMVMVNTHGNTRRVAPPGGKAPRLGTNPLAIGVPHADGPLLLDFGTSATAEGKVRVKKIAGQQCPDGWLLDCEGRPTNDPSTLYGNPPGTIRPMGGDQAYKGFGLGLMVEILSGALSGGVCIREKPINQNGNCVFMQVFDTVQLGQGSDHFGNEVAGLVDFVRDCPRIEGVKEILLPGDPERRVLQQRTATGIPLDDGNWRALADLASTLSVSIPPETS